MNGVAGKQRVVIRFQICIFDILNTAQEFQSIWI